MINLGSTSAVMQLSMGILYASGVVFGVSAGLILLHDFWRLLRGQTPDAGRVAVKESEEPTGPRTHAAGKP